MTFCCPVLNLPPKKEIVFYRQFYSTITHPFHQFSVSHHASTWFNSLIRAPGKSSLFYLRCSCVSPDQCIRLASSWVITYCLQNHFKCLSSNNLLSCLLFGSGYHIIQPGDLYYPLFTPNLSWHCRYFLDVYIFLYLWWGEIVSVEVSSLM
jgi:hypothetical protein